MKARLAVVVLVVALLLLGLAPAALGSGECGPYTHCVIKTVPVALHAKTAPFAPIGLYSPEFGQQVGTYAGVAPGGYVVVRLQTGLRAGYTVSRADTDMWDWPPPPPPQ